MSTLTLLTLTRSRFPTLTLIAGKATGIRGSMDLSTLDVQALFHLLEQAKDVKHQTAPVKELIEAAEVREGVIGSESEVMEIGP